jgi:hypothetical protein
MIIGARQQVLLPLFYPFYTLMPLAPGTMTIPAAIGGDVNAAANITAVYMPTQGRCSTLSDSTQGLLLVDGKRSITDSGPAQHIGYFPPLLHCVKTLSNGLVGSRSGR